VLSVDRHGRVVAITAFLDADLLPRFRLPTTLGLAPSRSGGVGGDHGAGAPGSPVCITERDTIAAVVQAISVRLDDEAERALERLEATGLSRSEAIRSALVAAAARLRGRSALAAEVAVLEADEADREEMLTVAALMESLRAPG
jgi:hypothetical protein